MCYFINNFYNHTQVKAVENNFFLFENFENLRGDSPLTLDRSVDSFETIIHAHTVF